MSSEIGSYTHPLISVITSVYNGNKYLDRCINSILNQSYKNIEYIIIDGGSSDGSLETIITYKKKIKFWISEPDKGIYDAWNKGLRKATGDWICFVGSDDILYPTAIEKFVEFFNSSNDNDCHLISARLNYITKTGTKKSVIGKPWVWNEFIKENSVAHVGTMHNKLLFEKYGTYDVSYKIVGDYELLLRPKNELNALFLNEIIGEMREGGISFSFKAINEAYKARVTTGDYSRFKASFDLIIMYIKFFNFKYLKKRL